MKQIKDLFQDKMQQENSSSSKKVSNCKPKLSASEAKALLFTAMSNASIPAPEGVEISEIFEELIIRTNDEPQAVLLSDTAKVLFVLVHTLTQRNDLAFEITKIYLSAYEIFDLELCSKYFEFYKLIFKQEEN